MATANGEPIVRKVPGCDRHARRLRDAIGALLGPEYAVRLR